MKKTGIPVASRGPRDSLICRPISFATGVSVGKIRNIPEKPVARSEFPNWSGKVLLNGQLVPEMIYVLASLARDDMRKILIVPAAVIGANDFQLNYVPIKSN